MKYSTAELRILFATKLSAYPGPDPGFPIGGLLGVPQLLTRPLFGKNINKMKELGVVGGVPPPGSTTDTGY